MIVLADTEKKNPDKIQCQFIVKTVNNLETNSNFIKPISHPFVFVPFLVHCSYFQAYVQ